MKTLKFLFVLLVSIILNINSVFAQSATPTLPGGGSSVIVPAIPSGVPGTELSAPLSLPIGNRAMLTAYAKQQIRRTYSYISGQSLVNYDGTKTWVEKVYTPTRADDGVDINEVLEIVNTSVLSFEATNPNDWFNLGTSLRSANGRELFSGGVNFKLKLVNGVWQTATIPTIEFNLVGRVEIPFPGAQWAKMLLQNGAGETVQEERVEVDSQRGVISFSSHYAGTRAQLVVGTYFDDTAKEYTFNAFGDGELVKTARADGIIIVPSIRREIMTAIPDSTAMNQIFGSEYHYVPLVQWNVTRELGEVHFSALAPSGERAHTMWMYSSVTGQWKAYELPSQGSLILKVPPALYDIIFEFKEFGKENRGFYPREYGSSDGLKG